MRRPPAPDPEIVALKGLAFLAGSPPDFERFLLLSGTTPEDAQRLADEPDFLAGVLDFLLGADSLLLAFCDAESLEPKDVHIARTALSGTSLDRGRRA